MKRRLLMIALALLFLLAIVGIPSVDTDFHEGRWQFEYDTALWTFVLDRFPRGPNESLTFNLMIPDRYCYRKIGGYVGGVLISYIMVPGDTNFVIYWNGGPWFGIGGCVWDGSWSTGKLERKPAPFDPDAPECDWEKLGVVTHYPDETTTVEEVWEWRCP